MDKPIAFMLDRAYRLWRRIKKNRRIRSILYRARNSRIFGDVFVHELMLADRVRVDVYHEAIKKYVSEGDVVIDVGTGTGILAFFASRQKPKRVYALDHGNIINLSKFIAQKNGIRNIEFIPSHSADFKPNEKADIIIHEQIGDYFFDEDMIKNICEIRDRLLAPSGRILPGKFEVFLEPVSLKDDHRTPYLWEQKIHGIDFSAAKEWLARNPESLNSRPYWRITPGDVSHFLCNPEKAFAVDLLTARPDSVPAGLKLRKKVTKDGPMDGFAFYFKIIFDEDLSIETGPFAVRAHWPCQLFRTERIDLEKGDLLDIEWEIGDHTDVRTWRVDHRVVRREKPPAPSPTAPSPAGVHPETG